MRWEITGWASDDQFRFNSRQARIHACACVYVRDMCVMRMYECGLLMAAAGGGYFLLHDMQYDSSCVETIRTHDLRIYTTGVL
jgi:hypothetical protein